MDKHDDDLIAECLAGETRAFSELVLRYQNRLYNTLVHTLGSAEDARDVAQDAFVQAFQKLHTFQGKSAFYSWLFRIAMNAAVSQQRKQQRVPISIDAAREKVGFEPADDDPRAQPEHALDTSERQAVVRLALAELSEDYRTVLVLKEMEGLKYEEIAVLVNCPLGTVRSRIHRARSELRERLQVLLKESLPSG